MKSEVKRTLRYIGATHERPYSFPRKRSTPTSHFVNEEKCSNYDANSDGAFRVRQGRAGGRAKPTRQLKRKHFRLVTFAEAL